MENQTSFDLTAAIRRWRENLAQSPSFRADNLDELESHLQDSMQALSGRGLSAEEAFILATRRIGSGATLAAEFARVNGHGLWIDRLLWMLLGATAVSAVGSLISSIGLWVTIPSKLPVIPLALVWVSPLILAAIILRSLVRSDGSVRRVLTGLLWRPLRLSFVVFLLGLFAVVLRAFALSYITGHSTPRPVVVANVFSLVGWIIAALSIFLVASRRLRSTRT